MVSVFEKIKKDICKEIQNTKDFTELRHQMKFILEEWDLSEENNFYDAD